MLAVPTGPVSAQEFLGGVEARSDVSAAPVQCREYADYVADDARGLLANPERGQYGLRHALPALAHYARTGDARYERAIRISLESWEGWARGEIRTKGGVHSFEAIPLLGLYARELRKRGDWNAADEAWLRALVLLVRERWYGLEPGDGAHWRGSQHRGMVTGSNNLIAAQLFPRERGASEWTRRGERIWNDWWQFRDIGINDTAYFYDSLLYAALTADITGRDAVFTDDAATAILWNRLVAETTPDGALVPYGPHAGWHGNAGIRIYALELAAAKSGNADYRAAAARTFRYAQARGGFSPGQDHWRAVSREAVALAYLACTDSVRASPAFLSSQITQRPEIVRLSADHWKKGNGRFDAAMTMSARRIPDKLALFSGNTPGDMFMLVEAFTRHDPLNPTAILALEAGGASHVSPVADRNEARGNAVRIEDRTGSAQAVGFSAGRGRRALPLGYDAMEASIPAFHEDAKAVLSKLDISNYEGFRADQSRDILFVKNRFVLLRDTTRFADRFAARLGPEWYTQVVGQRSDNWLDTRIDTHWYNADLALYRNPAGNLLIWHAPRRDAELLVETASRPDIPRTDQRSALGHFVRTQYRVDADVTAGSTQSFATVLLPHDGRRDARRLAKGIALIEDRADLVVVALDGSAGTEIALLGEGGNSGSLSTPLGIVETDAEALYLSRDGTGRLGWSFKNGTYLRIDGRVMVDLPQRGSATR